MPSSRLRCHRRRLSNWRWLYWAGRSEMTCLVQFADVIESGGGEMVIPVESGTQVAPMLIAIHATIACDNGAFRYSFHDELACMI